MRRHLLIAVMFGAISGAQAADMPDNLRGSIPPTLSTSSVNWQGYYIGGQGGYGSADENFTGSKMFTDPLFRAMYAPNSSLLAADPIIGGSVPLSPLVFGKATARTSGYGAFAGYNSQWDDVVIGIEASYLHGDFGGSSTVIQRNPPNPLQPSLPLADGYDHRITSISTAAISISDMATFRARAAYVYGCFLPYMFGGFAVGNADVSRTASFVDMTTPSSAAVLPKPDSTATLIQSLHNHLIYGYTFGLGVDINLIGGLFLRAEWEYIRFAATVDTSVNTARAGLGYKF
jgi:outer membrane immunogenic protein